MSHIHGYFFDFFYKKLFIEVAITVIFTVCVCSFKCFCWKNWPGVGDSGFWQLREFFVEMEPACCCNCKNCIICGVFVLDSSIPIRASNIFYHVALIILAIWLVLRNLFTEKVQLVWTTRRLERIVSEYAKKLSAQEELSIRLFLRLLWLKWKPALKWNL